MSVIPVIAALAAATTAADSAPETAGEVVVHGVAIPYRLTMPAHPRGAVLLIPGSLYSDVDGDYPAMGLRPHAYADLARQLGARGLAVVRMAKIGPGTGSRTIDPTAAKAHLAFSARVDVAAAGWRLLAGVPGRHVVAGHSEGAPVAFLLAARPDIAVDGVVSLSGPSTSIYAIMRAQMGITGPASQPFDRAVAALRDGRTLPADLAADPQVAMLAGLPPAAIAYLNSVDAVDPRAAAAAVRQPMLIVQGGRDASVPATHADALAAARGTRPTMRALFPTLTHFYKVAPAGLPPMQSMALTTESDPAVAARIADWIAGL